MTDLSGKRGVEMAELKIENQAMMFAFLSRAAIEAKGEAGREAIQEGMIKYGRERGARMAMRAEKAGDPVDLWTNQAYGEWKPDYAGQMEFGMLRAEPTYQTYIAKCAWCEAWKKYDILEYGREYCVHVDEAVYDGFGCGAKCTPLTTSMSWGGDRCDFDWGKPLREEELKLVTEKKAELGTSAMRDFNFHTAHIYFTVSDAIRRNFPEDSAEIIDRAVRDYTDLYGQEAYDCLLAFSSEEFFTISTN